MQEVTRLVQPVDKVDPASRGMTALRTRRHFSELRIVSSTWHRSQKGDRAELVLNIQSRPHRLGAGY
jgi:hypothetical protein